MSRKTLAWLSALGAYALALAGAIGFAYLLRLDRGRGLLLVGAVAVIALFGSFIPILRLGYRRLDEEQRRAPARRSE